MSAWLQADWPAPPGVRALTTTRYGLGVSQAPFDAFNLGARCGDAPDAVAENRRQLAAALRLAREVEALGYRRYWVAEHHSMPGIASSSPAVLLARVAAETSTIRLGSGGVMLPNHSPLVIAEQFGMLEAFEPGRIDLGIGRAPGPTGGLLAGPRRA